ncbi:MAG: 4-hydroxy-tetrahydrodipicolinate synthase [Bacteroidales bacterium]|nr:4-hydroxy-tetrahydrodipicolinate synthase [Bacteroidales bacterium]
MDNFNLEGLGVALVTPFRSDFSIDYEALSALLERLADSEADYLVVLGTTAETPTLSREEQASIRRFVVDKINGRMPLVLGCGGNNTLEIINILKQDDLSGFSAILSVVPQYNKPSQEGIFLHFSAIAEASPLPVILYNVPGRTGVNMNAETTLRLAASSHKFLGIKEASGSMAQVEKILKEKPSHFKVVSGDDALTLPMMALGASGVISVLGNVRPDRFGRMVHCCLKGDFDEARTIHNSLLTLTRLLFAEGNPAGIKSALSTEYNIKNVLRLPLVPVSEKTAIEIKEALMRL